MIALLRLTAPLGLVLAAACAARRTPPPALEPPELGCVCGTTEEALYGCRDARCAAGVGRPERDGCTCAADAEPADGAAAELERAAAARAAGLLDRAAEHYARALRLEPGLAPLVAPELASLAGARAALLAEAAAAALAEGREEAARAAWTELLIGYPTAPAAAEARAALARRAAEARDERAGWRAATPDATLLALRPAIDALERALEYERRGLGAGAARATAIVLLEAALADAERAAAELERALAGAQPEGPLADAGARLSGWVRAARIEAGAALARVYAAAGAFESARRAARAALRVDPAWAASWALEDELATAARRAGWRAEGA